MENVVPIKVQPLSDEAFRPYGTVLGLKSPVFPEVDGGKHVVLMIRLKRAANNRRLEQLAIHPSYNQTFIPLQGSMVLIVAPPPRNPDAGHDKYELDYDKLGAFVMEPGEAVIVDKGTWHAAVPLGEDCLMLSGTRKGAEDYTATISGGVQEGGRIPVADHAEAKKATPYIEFVDLKKRDNRVMELQL